MPLRHLNEIYINFIALLVFLAPIPAGSNRPLPWALWSLFIACAVVGYMGSVLIFDRHCRLRVLRHWPLLMLAMIPPAFGLVQMLPIPWARGDFDMAQTNLPIALSMSASGAALGVLRLVSYLGLFVLTYEVCRREDRIRRMLWLILVGIVGHAVWAMGALRVFGDVAPWGPKSEYIGFATGTFVNRNSFASYVGMGVIVAVTLALDRGKKVGLRGVRHSNMSAEAQLRRPALVFIVVVLILALLSTQSRMGCVATFLAVGVVVSTTAVRFSTRPLRVLIWSTIGSVAVAISATILFAQGLAERLLYSAVNFETRLELYRQTFALIAKHPFVGVGLDSFAMAFPLVHEPELPTNLVWDLPHNSYLTLWAELGVVAGTAQFAVGIGIFVFLVRSVFRHKRMLTGAVAAIGVTVLAGLHSLVDFSFEIEANMFVFVVLLAVGLSHASVAEASAQDGPC